jgi:TPR repeat protein/MoaA/NifB/PqqE/SkfB family radical SAM enzyme
MLMGMGMYPYDALKQVHLEITDKCNAACPQCPRNDHGGPVNPQLSLTELDLRDVEKIFPLQFVRQLNSLYACGNYGDPIVARDCLPIFQYFRKCNPDIKLGIHTNGGTRSIEFWQELGGLLPRGKGYVRFGIDGLQNTNHVYRRNVRWQILMRNVKAFIAAGGNAEWNYLVFRHNEHQVEQARELADELGFTLFNPKKTGRFVDYKNMEYIESTPVKDRKGEIVGQLERPTNSAYQNQALEGLGSLQSRYGSMERYLDATEIRCKVQAIRSVYVSADGYVFPCCWLGAQVHQRVGRSRSELLALLERLGGTDHIDAHRRSVREIVEDEFFQRLIPDSWSKSGCAAGKLRTCARVCGQEFRRHDAQSTVKRRPVKAPGTDDARGEVGHAGARIKRAEAYRDGKGVEKDYQQALYWYALLAQKNDSPGAKYEIGELYRTGGPKVPKDEVTAVRWYREAAGQGLHWAQYQLGEAYRTGGGVETDLAEAARFYEMAALQGNHWAQYRLSECFRSGEGKPRDLAAANDWLRRSAEQGNPWAMLQMGDFYRTAEGVDQDLREAASWYDRSAQQGNKQARRRLAEIGMLRAPAARPGSDRVGRISARRTTRRGG